MEEEPWGSDCEFDHLNIENKKSPVITVSIFNFSFPALIDSGSEISCISGDVYAQLGDFQEKIPSFPVTGIRITGAFKTKQRKIAKQLFLDYKIANNYFSYEFLLISDLVFPIILGIDFLFSVKSKINLENDTITLLNSNKEFFTVSTINTIHFYIPPSDIKKTRTIALKKEYSLNTLNTDRNGFNTEFINENKSLTFEQKNQFKYLLLKYKNIFSDIPGRTELYYHKIKLINETPFKVKQYPIPIAHREAVDNEIKRMLDRGVIERASTQYISPLVTEVKKDGSVRVCLDARHLNRVLEKEYELPRPIDDIMKSLFGKPFKTSLDLSSGYWQIPLRPSDKKYTGFLVGTKCYQFTVLPFGLSTAVSSFSRCISELLGSEFDDFVIPYLDDILIASKNFEDHLNHLDQVFSRLNEAGLTVKFRKCQFMPEKLNYLGYIVSTNNIEPDPERIQCVQDYPKPKNKKDIQSFLGLCNYDRGFCENFSGVTEPLSKLLRTKNKWVWNTEQDRAFDELKRLLKNATLLYHPDNTATYYVQSDASDYAIAAQLFQRIEGERRVIAYASRLLLDRERNYTSNEKEILALVFALKKWRIYLLGRHFEVLTDNRALCYIQTCRLLTPRVTRWALALQEYDFKISFVKGSENKIADILSRNPGIRYSVPGEKRFKVFSSSIKFPDKLNTLLKKLPAAQKNDSYFGPIYKSLENQQLDEKINKFVLKNQLLFVRESDDESYRLCIPSEFKNKIIYDYHVSLGHFGIFKTWSILKNDFWWKGMFRDIKKCLKACDICQKAKLSLLPKAPLSPVISEKKNEIISLDLYGPLPQSTGGVTFLCVIVDLFTKYVTLYPLKKATTRAILNRLILDYFKKMGKPERILTDHGSQFTSKSWSHTLQPLGIKVVHCSVRHPQSNPVERYMRELGRLFRTYCFEQHTAWAKHVRKFGQFFNSVVHESTGFTPSELHFKEPLTSFTRELVDYPDSPKVLSYEKKLILAKEILQSRAERRKILHPGRHYKEFATGDLVLLKANPVSSALSSKTKKFLLLFEGPYRIKKKVGLSTYILIMENTDEERGMFHVSHLKPYNSDVSSLKE